MDKTKQNKTRLGGIYRKNDIYMRIDEMSMRIDQIGTSTDKFNENTISCILILPQMRRKYVINRNKNKIRIKSKNYCCREGKVD